MNKSESYYAIFVWRFTSTPSPTIHLRDPTVPLPPADSDGYTNPSYYLLRPPPVPPKLTKQHKSKSVRSLPNGRASTLGKKSKKGMIEEDDGIPKHKKEFEKFHGENGVRTVAGSIGPVNNGTASFTLLV